MSIDELTNKSVLCSISSNPKALGIVPKGQQDDLRYLIERLERLYKNTQDWDLLSSSEKFHLEERWTDTMLSIIKVGNHRVLRSMHYSLIEQTVEEEELEGSEQ
jgi:hypothetical protein